MALFGYFGEPNRPNRNFRVIRVRFLQFFQKLRFSKFRTRNSRNPNRPNRTTRIDRTPRPDHGTTTADLHQTIRTPHLHHSPTRLELLFGVENAAAHTSTMNSMVGRENGHLHAWSERKTPPLPWRGPCEWCHAARAHGRRGGLVDTNV